MDTFSNERMAKAIELARQGNVIDGEIMGRGVDPWHTMKLREGYGYTWVPSLLQPPIPVAPGIVFPGAPLYDPDTMPKGAVKVSSITEDYPMPAVDDTPPAIIPGVPAEPNWRTVIGSYAQAQPLDKSPDGTVYAGPKGRWLKHSFTTPWGKQEYWEKVG